jgi:hypothetical protein
LQLLQKVEEPDILHGDTVLGGLDLLHECLLIVAGVDTQEGIAHASGSAAPALHLQELGQRGDYTPDQRQGTHGEHGVEAPELGWQQCQDAPLDVTQLSNVLSLVEDPVLSLVARLELLCLVLIEEANERSGLVVLLAVFDNFINDASILR